MSQKDPMPGPLGTFNIVMAVLVFAALWVVPVLFVAAAIKWTWLYLFGGAS